VPALSCCDVALQDDAAAAAAIQAVQQHEQAGGGAPPGEPAGMSGAHFAAADPNVKPEPPAGRRQRLGASLSGPSALGAAAAATPSPGGAPDAGVAAPASPVLGLKIRARSLSEGAAAQLPIAPLRLAPLSEMGGSTVPPWGFPPIRGWVGSGAHLCRAPGRRPAA